MKMKLYKPERKPLDVTEIVNHILLIIIGALIGLILIGTIIGFATKTAKPGKYLRTPDPSPDQIESLNKKRSDKIDAYTGINTLRILTLPADEESGKMGASMVVTPWFSYPEGDTEFFEELSRKRNVIAGIITNYFTTKTKEEILHNSEEEIKAFLKEEINSQMTVGRITDLYFTDYLFLD